MIDFDYFKSQTKDKPIGINGEIYYQIHSADFPNVRGLFSGLHQVITKYAEEMGFSQIVDNSLAAITPAQYIGMINGMSLEQGRFKVFAMAMDPDQSRFAFSGSDDDARASAIAFAYTYEWVKELSDDIILISPDGKILDHKLGSPIIRQASQDKLLAWKEACGVESEKRITVPQPVWFI